MKGFKELPDNLVQIGSKTFHIHRHDFHNGTIINLEVGGGARVGYMEVLPIEELQSVRIMDMPKGFSLDIYMPSLPATPEIEGINIKNIHGKGRCNFRLGFMYSNWEIERNLLIYSREIAARLLLELPDCRSAYFNDEEVGTSVACDLEVPIEADLHQYLHELDKRVHEIIRAPARKVDRPVAEGVQLKPDEHGMKWWIRHVLIPLAGSAAVVGLFKMFM